MASLWDHEEETVAGHGIKVPRWIDQDIDLGAVAAIVQGGCASGAYMPAVTYHQALETMNKNGDAIMDYLEDADQLYQLWLGREGFKDASWAGLACDFVSAAVELWASSVADELETLLEEAES